MINSEGNGEFGRGFTYCLGLFLKHGHKDICEFFKKPDKDKSLTEILAPHHWFCAAYDHLEELQIPALPENIKDKVVALKQMCRDHAADIADRATWDDKQKAVGMAEDILRDIDAQIFKVDVVETEWA